MSEFIWVRRQSTDGRIAKVPLRALGGAHWDDVSGGIQLRASRPYLHAYVPCDAVIEGELSHSCMHGPPPHSIKVCIVKKDNPIDTWSEVFAEAAAAEYVHKLRQRNPGLGGAKFREAHEHARKHVLTKVMQMSVSARKRLTSETEIEIPGWAG